MGRPSDYSDEIAERICEEIAEGVTLRAICRRDDMPTWSTVYLWADSRPDFFARIVRARKLGCDAIAEEAMEIINTPVVGVETTINPDGTIMEKRGDMLGHRRLQFEGRLKLLAKWYPSRYGERIDVEHGGTVGHTHMTLAQFAERLAEAKRLSGRVVEIEQKSEP